MKKTILILTLLFAAQFIKSQDFTKFSISGYVDTYYAWDDDKNGNPIRQFSSTVPYREEFRLNIAQVSLKYNDAKVRGMLTLHYGDIPSVNWPQNQQFIQEAFAGFSPAKNLWVDAGYFLTHIGAEGLLPKGNFFNTLALPTYYEPFFQSGVRVSYEFSPKVYGSLHLLNGYNVFADNNKNKTAGITLGVKPAKNIEIIYNNLIGNEISFGSEGKTRMYNNLVFKYSPSSKVDFLLGADLAFQEKSSLTDSTASATMYSGLAAVKFKITKKFSASLRGEIFNDKNGFLSGVYTDNTGKQTGLIAYGVTLGIEVRPVDNAYFRIESRYLSAESDQKIFYENKNSRIEANTSIGIEF